MDQSEVTLPENHIEETRYPSVVSEIQSRGSTSKNDSSSASETYVKEVRRRSSKEGDEQCLSKAIQAKAKKLAENLPFKECELADEVVKRGCITEDECKAIRENNDRKTQVRDILLIVKTRSYKTMKNFLDAAKVHCPSIVEDIWKMYNRNIAENRGCIKRLCWLCNLKSSVDVKRVIDALWCEEILADPVVREINASKEVVGRQDKHWEALLYECFKNSSHGLRILCQALDTNGHYTHIAKKLRAFKQQNEQVLSCTCSNLNVRHSEGRPLSINSEPEESLYSEEESILPAESMLSEGEWTVRGDSSPSEEEFTETEPGHETDEEKKTRFLRFDKIPIEVAGSSVAPEAQCSSNVQRESRHTSDQPRKDTSNEKIDIQQRKRNDTCFWKRCLPLCGPKSFTVLDEIGEEDKSD